MSFSILGWIEFRDGGPSEDDEAWHAVVNTTWLMPQNHSASCSCLFGIRNYNNWEPVVSTRGLPDDASERVRLDATEEGYFYYSATWLTWHEIQQVNWEESVIESRKETYHRSETGELIRNVERITRREAAGSAFSDVFELMVFFARRYGDGNVRLVVWFGE